MLQTSTVKESTFELLIPEIRMLGYQFDFAAVEKRIIKMTDNADKVYSTAPLKRTNK